MTPTMLKFQQASLGLPPDRVVALAQDPETEPVLGTTDQGLPAFVLALGRRLATKQPP